MTSKYRVEYALKSHRRDQLIEWIKGLLAVPFVLHALPAPSTGQALTVSAQATSAARQRYAEIMLDAEALVNDHIGHQKAGNQSRSKLKQLVPSVGTFFTPLPLQQAFLYQDECRNISSRRFVPPSFNDIRLTMNTAQLLSLTTINPSHPIDLITFDGDVTLYPDGSSLSAPGTPIVTAILHLLTTFPEMRIGIVTAAGYTGPMGYYSRLAGLLDAMASHKPSSEPVEADSLAGRLVVVGGECNNLFEFDSTVGQAPYLKKIEREKWMLPEMLAWPVTEIQELLDVAEQALRECIQNLKLQAQVIRKERAVGIVHDGRKEGFKAFTRENLEETVLMVQQRCELSDAARVVPFCAFNGGNDVFVDIGDKSWGVRAIQNYLGRRGNVVGASIEAGKSLHVGDQFLSAGANDYKARLACTTAWVASPQETLDLLMELDHHRSQAIAQRD